MSMRSGLDNDAEAMAASTIVAEVERQVHAAYEQGNMRSLAEELVRLRVSHNTQRDEIVALHQQLRQTAAEKLQPQLDLRRMSELKTQLDTELKNAMTIRRWLEKRLATAGDDTLVRRIHCLERQAAVAERLAEADAEDEIRRRGELLDLVNTLRTRSRGLDVDALRCVLEHLSLPAGLVHHSNADGLGIRWSKMVRDLKSVTLVCKSWHTAAYPLLYRDVHLREVGQIVAFADTLRSSPQTFASHVRTVMVACFIPPRLTRVARESLTFILQQCSHLDAFIFRPVYDERQYSTSAPLPVLSDNLSPLTIPLGVKHLGLFDERHLYGGYGPDPSPPFSLLALMLSWCSHLTSLSISETSLPATTNDSLALHFPQLQTLSIWSYDGGECASEFLPLLWEMPKLVSLRFRPALACADEESGMRLASFCRQHAGTLRELDFGGDLLCQLSLPSLENQLYASGLCPHLEHLVMCISGASHYPNLVVPRDVIWNTVKESSIWNVPLALVEVTIKPAEDCNSVPLHQLVRGSAWRRVRFLETQLLTWVPDLPYLFPVSDEALVEPRIMDCYGLKIEESADRLALIDEDWQPPRSAPADVDDDGGHDDSDSETSDSSYEYESEVSEDYVTDEGESDVGPEELGDLTQEQALAIYADVLDA